MARAMWRGAIQFGLVTIPVKLYLATEPRGGLSFNLLHKDAKEGGTTVPCLRRIQMKTHCPEHGEISRTDTVRGYEWSKGQYVIIEEGDLESVPLKTIRAIEIEQFVEADRGQYGTTFVKQAYYLEPEAIGRKAFYLLKSVLKESGLQAIAKIVLKDREMLAALDPYSTTMLLSTLYWPDEVRELGELELPEAEYEFKPAEIQMATQLVQAMTGEFDAAQYHDDYREALMRVIQAKIDGQPMAEPEPMPQASKLTDLMAVLEASVAAARQSRAAGGADAPAAKPAARTEAPTSVAEARRSRSAKPAAPATSKGSAAKPAAKAPTTSAAASRATASRAAASRAAASRATERKRKSA